ncbi:TIGR00289 family protein [Candidatus Micrarchaeota archaeon]|nr:TIGR00289 family protein [Candidatus Micrarchaeota archaeon]MBU2476775.1 TIGR00289 family protein [Candidatus Micrarchaeota archaeon]
MKVAGLFSGGKDSCFAVNWAFEQKHKVVVLISVISKNPYSFMFHTPNIKLTFFQGLAAEIPVLHANTLGNPEKELDDLKNALIKVKENFGVQGIVTGALASSYQKKRIEKICEELELECFSPLWQKDQKKYVKELVQKKFEVLVSAVAAKGLNEKWLGRILDKKVLSELIELDKKIGLNVAGEGGEYETFVLNAPFFKKKLEVIEAEKHWDKTSGFLEIKELKLVEK